VLVGPEGHVAEQQVDDLHGPSIPYSGVTLHRSRVILRLGASVPRGPNGRGVPVRPVRWTHP
jgi:hypothetical protein